MRKTLLLGTILVLIFTFLPIADAYQAKWMGTKLTFKYDVKVPGTGKFKTRLKTWDDPIYFDSSLGTKIQLQIGTALGAPNFEADVEGKSDRKANVVAVEKEEVESFMSKLDAYLDDWNQKGRQLDYMGVTYDDFKVKGKLNVNGKYNKCSFKLKIKFTGTVNEGEHEGEDVKGSFQVVLKGERD
ncbi:MAG: hypothetical protein ABFS86_10000 [Planctomycetota bacterium]